MLKPLEPANYKQLFGPVDTVTTLRAADWTVTRLKELGATPPAGGRLLRARAFVEQQSGRPMSTRRGAPERRMLAEAHRTLLEFYAAARSFNPQGGRLPKIFRDKLRLAYGGRDDPADDGDGSVVARNTQFELWLAAWLTAGRKPIRMGEPDLEAAYRFEWRGLAAKRIRSRTQIVKRVREAADQVRKASGTGFVAISLDNYSVTSQIRARSSLRVGERFFQAYPEIDSAADNLQRRKPWVRALICFGHYARWVTPKSPSLQMDNLTKIILLPEDEEDSQYLRSYFDEQQRDFHAAWRQA